MSSMSIRVIIGKNGRKWRVPKGVQGTPIEQIYPGARIPENVKGALVYEIDGERIIARQDPTPNE